VRELENVIERAVVMSGQETLMPDAFAFDDDDSDGDLGAGVSQPVGVDSASGPGAAPGSTIDSSHARRDAQPAGNQEEGTLQTTLDRAATVRIKAALAAAGGNRVEAATTLGVDRTTLYRLMKRLSL
jgi:DNA-binding NtrC family response regulator